MEHVKKFMQKLFRLSHLRSTMIWIILYPSLFRSWKTK